MTDPELQQELAQALFRERRSERRWRNIRFFTWIFIILLVIAFIYSPTSKKVGSMTHPYAAIVKLNGLILPETNFSAQKVVPVLDAAFKDKNAKGVVLLINSPGGSAVQSSIIHDKIIALKTKYHKKVIVVGEDALASGAYLIASAADKIYVNEDTLTGSIGVVMSSFGFTDAIQKLGITRRLITAGENKARLDPFEPLKQEDVVKVQTVLHQIHQSFIKDIVEGRKKRLNGNPAILFSGDFWVGPQAVSLGLVDGLGDVWSVLEKEFSVSHVKDYSPKASPLQALLRGVDTTLNLGLTTQKLTGYSTVMAIKP